MRLRIRPIRYNTEPCKLREFVGWERKRKNPIPLSGEPRITREPVLPLTPFSRKRARGARCACEMVGYFSDRRKKEGEGKSHGPNI